MADLAKEIGRHLPYLRRYARAITGEQGTGDRTVKAALERLLAERPSDLDDNPRLALYRSLHDVLRGGQAAAGGAGEGEDPLAHSGIPAHPVQHPAPPPRQNPGLAAPAGVPAPGGGPAMRP